MNYLKIQNNGLLDVRLISLMGGTTKANDKFKIGQFGTGLKYSLAYLIRNNIDFKIFVGSDQVNISVKRESISNNEFDIIYIDGERTSVTSNMGHAWEPWMICREIWCNALDEGGEVLAEVSADELQGNPETTTFYIQLTGGIKETFDNWSDYFIHDQEPIFECSFGKVYPGGQNMRIYKNGVLVSKKTTRSIFNYDFPACTINELREYKGFVASDINYLIKSFDKKTADLLLSKVGNDENYFENGLDYDWGGSFSKGWKECIGDAKIISKEDLDTLKKREVHIDEAKLVSLPQSMYDELANQFEGISAVRRADKVNSFYEVHDEKLTHKIKEAIAVLETCGYYLAPEINFITGVFGDKGVFARVNMDSGEVLISEQLNDKSMFDVVSCLIEENEHFKTGLEDCSRKFQQHWINMYTKQLLQLNDVKL